MSAGHPRITQFKQRHEMRGVLGQSPAAHLVESELALDESERVLHLGSHTGFELLSPIEQFSPRADLVQRPTLARLQRYFPPNTSSFGPLKAAPGW